MPTYASTASFDLSIDDIAEEAYERCGLQVRSGYDLQTARRSLNLLLAEWANRGLNLWTIQLQEASDKLHRIGYYKLWPKGYYQDVVVSRQKTYRRIFGGQYDG